MTVFIELKVCYGFEYTLRVDGAHPVGVDSFCGFDFVAYLYVC